MTIDHRGRKYLRNDSAWHHVHAAEAKNHPMLSPMMSPEGAPLDCDYVCPTAIGSNWQEQRRQRNSPRFKPCPNKFAARCHNDTATANTALDEYERIGSGKYRNPEERNAFRRDVLMKEKLHRDPVTIRGEVWQGFPS